MKLNEFNIFDVAKPDIIIYIYIYTFIRPLELMKKNKKQLELILTTALLLLYNGYVFFFFFFNCRSSGRLKHDL